MAIQLPVFQPRTDWRPPVLSQLPTWAGARRVSVDIETHDPDLKKTGIGVRRRGRIVGVSFAIERADAPPSAAKGYYMPFGHEGGDNLDREQVLAYLRDQAAAFRGDLVGANLPYDLDYLAQAGVEFRPRFFRDVQIAEPLLDELQMSYSLDNIARRRGMSGKDQLHLELAAKRFGIDPKADMWKLPGRHVGPYAEVDATLPLQLIQAQENALAAEDDDGRLWALYDLESRLLPVLLRMRRRGVRVDFEHLDVVEAKSLREEDEALKEFSRLSGVNVSLEDINRPTVVGRAIEAATGAHLPTTPKSKQPSIKLAVLKPYEKHPAVAMYMRARRFNKLRTTFVESIRTHSIGDRVHCTFNQLRATDDGSDEKGTISGRLSSTEPNLQQQPNRDKEIGPFWRAIYLPDEGQQWACLDYSQQEPRWVVHFAEVTGCRKAAEAAEKYRTDPTTDNHSMMTKIVYGDDYEQAWYDDESHPNHKNAKKLRTDCKTIYLGLLYGMGGAKLCRGLGYETKWIENRAGRLIEVAGPEGQAVLDKFHAGVPFIAELVQRVEAVAKKRGYIRTILGRRCHFPRNEQGPGYDWTYKALNRLIQGSSADQTKKAMVDADDAGIALQLQVHDEIDLSITSLDQAQHLAEIMRTTVQCNVPAAVDIEVGPNWGKVKKVTP